MGRTVRRHGRKALQYPVSRDETCHGKSGKGRVPPGSRSDRQAGYLLFLAMDVVDSPMEDPATGSLQAWPVWLRVLSFATASSISVCFPLALGKWLWPAGLSGGAEYVFWIASGINIAGVLLLGWRHAPAILLGALPAIFLLGEPVERSVLGAAGNCIEALLAWWLLVRWGGFRGSFDRVRTVLVLMLASFVAPIAGSLAVPGWLVSSGRFTTGEFWAAVGNWHLANGVAILVIPPFLLALRQGRWKCTAHRWEAAAWLIAGTVTGLLAFDAVFQARGLNFAFLVFPFIILAAVRYGPEETSASLVLVMIAIYITLVQYAPGLSPDMVPGIVWFLQAFFWVAASTALLVATLVAERRHAEEATLLEKQRHLEASLREERARLDALRYQINPHFLFNALNSIRAALPLESAVPREMVTELSSYLRTTLDRQEGDLVPLEDEIRSVSQYLAIEKARYGDELDASFQIPHELTRHPVPVFLLQPLLENAIRHGLEKSTSGIFRIKITAGMQDGRLILEVRNTGTWREPDGSSGLGLENIRRRLTLIYGNDATLARVEEEGQVCLRIRIPSPPTTENLTREPCVA